MNEKCKEGDQIKVIACCFYKSAMHPNTNGYYSARQHDDNKCKEIGKICSVLEIKGLGCDPTSSSSIGHGPWSNCNVHVLNLCVSKYEIVNKQQPDIGVSITKELQDCNCNMLSVIMGLGHNRDCKYRS